MKKLYDAITESLFDEEEQLDNIWYLGYQNKNGHMWWVM